MFTNYFYNLQILYRITVRGSAYTQMTRERPVAPGTRDCQISRGSSQNRTRPETGINNEYKQRLIQTKATTLKTTRHLNRGCSFVYFKLLCTRTAGTPSQFTKHIDKTGPLQSRQSHVTARASGCTLVASAPAADARAALRTLDACRSTWQAADSEG